VSATLLFLIVHVQLCVDTEISFAKFYSINTDPAGKAITDVKLTAPGVCSLSGTEMTSKFQMPQSKLSWDNAVQLSLSTSKTMLITLQHRVFSHAGANATNQHGRHVSTDQKALCPNQTRQL
jgi:hypothetical protein